MRQNIWLLGQAGETSTGPAAAAPAAPVAPAGAEQKAAPGEGGGGAAAPAAPGGVGQAQTQTQTSQPGGQEPASKPAPRKQGLGDMLIPLALMLVVLYFFMFRGPRKQQKQQKEMLAGVKKNDRVRTIGGIIGTVVDVRDDEVVVKVDEATNAKIHVVRSAIGKVYKEGEGEK